MLKDVMCLVGVCVDIMFRKAQHRRASESTRCPRGPMLVGYRHKVNCDFRSMKLYKRI